MLLKHKSPKVAKGSIESVTQGNQGKFNLAQGVQGKYNLAQGLQGKIIVIQGNQGRFNKCCPNWPKQAQKVSPKLAKASAVLPKVA